MVKLKKIFTAAILFLCLFDYRVRGLSDFMTEFENVEYTYGRFLIDEKSYSETVVINKGADYESVLMILKVNVVKEERVGGMRICFGYVNGLDGLYFFEGRFINIQIVDNGSCILVGSPYIAGGF
ncbi:MAG: hypothetical protein LBQ27_06085 [Clostridiales bacterium]|jgi:hypothetical protein|nr:hypothetical protein [Clostridiales bacterium]